MRKLLGDKSRLIVTEAAQLVGQRLLTDLTDALVAAFERFMIEPRQSDKTWRAKIAIVEALNVIEYDKEDVFLRAIRYVQEQRTLDRSKEDPAGPLRAAAAFGLVRINALVITR